MIQKHICTLQVPMHDIQIMKWLKPVDNLNRYFPKFVFSETAFIFLALLYLLKEVSIISIFHDDAKIGAFEAIRGLINESLKVLYNITVALDGCEDSYFIDRVLSFFITETFDDPDLF